MQGREEKRELAEKIIGAVQDQEQGLEQETEKVSRIRKYIEGSRRQLKVRMRSQVPAEEILAKAGKLSKNTD